ncbi:hypothetical protein LCGC14_2426800 [marine sediment metagenome]|uniref:Uncharacterized protein n=1 Tax=marine sediment metagenome TaxID=412755 RepID=A0A0F9BN68_9ZZZZ
MNFFLWLLPKLAKLHPRNHTEDRLKYPQLWYCMPKRYAYNRTGEKRRTFISLFLQWLCGIFTGHELSKTEWGYGGGELLDRNCRWCDKYFSIPKNEEPTKRDALEDLWNKP